jgi:hypothetical protein
LNVAIAHKRAQCHRRNKCEVQPKLFIEICHNDNRGFPHTCVIPILE